MREEPLESDREQKEEETVDLLYNENGFTHGFRPLSHHSESIRAAAILLQSGDGAEQFDFF